MGIFLKAIKNVLVIIIMLGFLSAGVDYVRMNSGDVPIFNISSYDQTSNMETFRGLFYIAQRKVKASVNEPLVDSSDMQYKILIFDLKVPRKFNSADTFTLETKVIDNCHDRSVLYFANTKIKVYTYCLESINITDGGKTKDLLSYLEKDHKIIDDIDNKLDFTGIYKDKTTLMFQAKNDEFTNNGLTMYRCNKEYINDVYLAPNDTPFMSEFCTLKDDDFKFVFEIEDKSEKPEPELDEEGKEKEIPKETFYSDEEYDYVFDYSKSDQIYIINPAIRGRAERRYKLKEILDKKMLTIEELEKKGLKFEKVKKTTE
ncbi:MAG: hypothetical protein IJG97_05765 [Bacilli bacterium]|nr:hypothetical protein [Bacilli bacterium]MBQ7240929.1 hypothetical protein [Bacilli bacterium]